MYIILAEVLNEFWNIEIVKQEGMFYGEKSYDVVV